MEAEHWLGLKKISCLTGAKPVAQLRVELADYEGRQKYARYRYFSVDSASANYKLSVGGYSGTAGDILQSRESICIPLTVSRGAQLHNHSHQT